MWTLEKIHGLFLDSAESRGPSPPKTHACIGTPIGALANKGFYGHLPFQAGSSELPGKEPWLRSWGWGASRTWLPRPQPFKGSPSVRGEGEECCKELAN